MKAILAAICLVLTIGAAQGCSCPRQPRWKKVCGTEFIMKAVVLSKLKNKTNQTQTEDAYYRIEMTREIKAPNVTVDMTRVWTASNDALCGVILVKGATYILAGNIKGERLNIELCKSFFIYLKNPSRKLPQFIRRSRCERLESTERLLV